MGAVSVAGAAQYMIDARMAVLADEVKGAALAISRDLGWSPAVRKSRRPGPSVPPA